MRCMRAPAIPESDYQRIVAFIEEQGDDVSPLLDHIHGRRRYATRDSSCNS
jgi:hypothetical protein